jgi:hypothetical protein
LRQQSKVALSPKNVPGNAQLLDLPTAAVSQGQSSAASGYIYGSSHISGLHNHFEFALPTI